jgi:hypothetical protein
MTYQLAKLEELISVTFRPETILISDLTPNQITKYLELTLREAEYIKNGVRQNIINATHQSSVEIYVRQHQLALTELANKISGYSTHPGIAILPDLVKFYHQLYDSIEELLLFIERYFAGYLDTNLPISANRFNYFKSDIADRLKEINLVIDANRLSNELFELIIQPLQEILSNTVKTISYHRVAYLKELAATVLAYLSSRNMKDKVVDLFEILFTISFNSPEFFHNYIAMTAAELRPITNISAKMELLYRYIKKIRLYPSKKGFILYPELPTIKDQVIGWLEEEIKFLQISHDLGKSLSSPKEIIQGEGKIHCSLSVAQLACFIRLLVEIKLITNANQTEMLRFFSEHFRTDKRESIAFESLRTKYYNIETSSAEAVKEWLFKLMNHIRNL